MKPPIQTAGETRDPAFPAASTVAILVLACLLAGMAFYLGRGAPGDDDPGACFCILTAIGLGCWAWARWGREVWLP